MYYTVIKHYEHLRTRGKCRKYEPQASVFYISRVFSNVRSVYHSVIHSLGNLHGQNNKTGFVCVLYSNKTLVFDQSGRAQGPVYKQADPGSRVLIACLTGKNTVQAMEARSRALTLSIPKE